MDTKTLYFGRLANNYINHIARLTTEYENMLRDMPGYGSEIKRLYTEYATVASRQFEKDVADIFHEEIRVIAFEIGQIEIYYLMDGAKRKQSIYATWDL